MRHLVPLLAALLVPAAASADAALDAEELAFLGLLNEYRASVGAPCLTASPTMNEAADFMSRAMGEQPFFSHSEPPCDPSGHECTGRDPFVRIADFGHAGWTTAGENIAAGSPSAAEVFEVWRNSEGHDRNMRDPAFTSIGIGRVEVPGSPYGVYWTNDFSNLVDGSPSCGDAGGGAEGGADLDDDDPGAGCSAAAGGSPLALLLVAAALRRR